MHDLLAYLPHMLGLTMVLSPCLFIVMCAPRGTSIVRTASVMRNGQWVEVRDRSSQHSEEEE